MSYCKIIFVNFIIFFIPQIYALDSTVLLPADRAFSVTAKAVSAELLEVYWEIAEGYYLYRDKTSVTTQSVNVQLGTLDMPKGKIKQDKFFGKTAIYRKQLKILLPLVNTQSSTKVKILLKYQGCSDTGILYPAQEKIILINLPVAKNNSGMFERLSNKFKINNLQQDELLPAEQAFKFFATVKEPGLLQVNWQIADDYYLYRDKIKLSVLNNDFVRLGDFVIPQGLSYYDEIFGKTHVFYNHLSFVIPIIQNDKSQQTFTLLAQFQGCAKRGVCYPPMQSKVVLQLAEQTKSTTNIPPIKSEQAMIAESLQSDSLLPTLFSFFGFGLLLAFTPCILPMLPILSGIIVGKGESITARKAFFLSLSYVLASALTYTIFGVVVALLGSNLQIIFQEPWVIAVFSGIFILLALSMFGFYNLELPKALQTKLSASSNKHQDGSYIGAAIMGVFSTLIVGPCVAAPLVGALIYIGQTGDALLGGLALFVMGFALGLPLLLLGASAGSLLPKAGNWLNTTKAIFGVVMLAMSIFMLDRILSDSIIMLLTAILLIIPAIYLHALDPLDDSLSGWYKLWKGLGIIMLAYGVLLLIGLSMGNTNLLKPLQGLSVQATTNTKHNLVFQAVASISELDKILEQNSINKQWVMLDFYADWCISCKEIEAYTFTDRKVQQKLSNFILLRADVTKNLTADQNLLQHFNLIGPPAILFFSPNSHELKAFRVVGYQNSKKFLSGINNMLDYYNANFIPKSGI